jgi:hypothetical protein
MANRRPIEPTLMYASMLLISILNLKSHCMEAEQNKPENPQENAIDRAGIGQTDEEKGIAPEAIRNQKRKELEQQEGVKKRPIFRAEDDEFPLQIEG